MQKYEGTRDAVRAEMEELAVGEPSILSTIQGSVLTSYLI
jgi:hypothetical protein